MIVLFALVFLVLLPVVSPAGAKSSSSPQISSHLTSAITPSLGQDFSLSANPASITTTPGSTKTIQITATSIGGFTGQVYMTVFSFSFPSLPVSLNPPIVTLASGGTASSTLTITIPSNASPGSNTVFIEATGGCTLFHSLDISVIVNGPDFTINSAKTHLTLAPGGSDTSGISLASLNGFAGTISLFSFSQFTTNLNPPSVILSPGGTGSSILTVTAPPTIDPGNYTITVDGSYFAAGVSLFHSASILVTVTGPSYSITASKFFLTLVAGGLSNSSTISVTPSAGFTGSVLLSASPAPPLIIGLSPTSVNIPPVGTSVLTVSAPIGTKDKTYIISVTGTSGTHHPSTVIVVKVKAPDFDIFADPFFMAVVAGGTACTSTIHVTGIEGFTGSVGLTLKGAPALTTNLNPLSVTVPGTSTLTVLAPTNTVPGFYSLEVNGTSATPPQTHSTFVEVLVIGPDFTLSANPDPVTITAGMSGTSTISIAPILSFAAPVALKASSFDPQLTVNVSPASITAPQTATLNVAVAPGTIPGDFYSVQVNGTSGQLTHSIYISIAVVGPDFTISANPSALSFAQGTVKTSTITINPVLGFNSPVDLFASSSSFNLNASIQPATVTSGSYTATLSVNSTIPGSYSVSIFANSGLLSHDITIPVVVVGPDFSLSDSPSSLTITAGGSKTSTISVNPFNGFTGAVALTASGPPGLTPTFAPTTITPPTTSILTVNGDPTVTPGTYIVDIQGTSGNIIHTTQLAVNVAGFTLTPSPTTLTIVKGTSQPSTITVTPLNGFTDTVTLSAALPTGLTGAPNPISITGGSGASTLTIAAASGIAPGTYLVNVTGTSGSLTQKATITVTVPATDFDIAAAPATVACTIGNSCTTTITINPINGFTGTVSFTASPSLGLLCDPVASITIPATLTTTLSCHSITSGTFTVTVTGTSGTLTHTTGSVTYNVAAPQDFSISAGPVTPSTMLAGASGTSTITIASTGGFTGAVNFQVSASTPSGLTCTTPTSVNAPGTSNLVCSATAAGDYTVTATGSATISGTQVSHTTSNILFHVVDFSISAGAVTPSPVPAKSTASSTITISPLNGFSGTVSFTVSASSPAGLTCTAPTSVSGTALTSTLSCGAQTPGDYTVTVTGTSGTLSHTTSNILFHVSGFTIAATSPAAVNPGPSASSTITINPVNGFTGLVSLTDTVPTGLTCGAITPNSITNSGTATVSCSSTTAGTYTLTVTGTSGTLSQTTTATFTVTDFAISATSPSGIIGSSLTSTITVTSQNGFSATVALTGPVPSGLSCSAITPSSVAGSGTATLSCSSTSANTYSVTITGASGTLTHPATATFTITGPPPDFSIAASSPAASTPGSSPTSTITVGPLYGFTGTVSLTDTIPSGLTCGAITPSSIAGSGTASVSCSSNAGATYTLTVTGVGGSLSHSNTATFTFTDFTISANTPAAKEPGETATSTITLAPVNGFTGTVSLSDTPLPTGLACSAISPASITLASTPTTATLACHSGQAGTFTVIITGTSGSRTPHAITTFTFRNSDINIDSTQPTSTPTGQSTTSTITITSVNGFTKTITLSISAPTGIDCTLDHTTLQGSGTATLTCTSSTPNDYTVTVTATGGAAAHTTTQTFHVSAAPSPAAPAPTILGLSPLLFYGLIGLLIVVVIGGVAVVIRRKNP